MDETLQARIDAWLEVHEADLREWEGLDRLAAGDLAGFLPYRNYGLYIVGKMHSGCDDDCEREDCFTHFKIGRAKDIYTRVAGIRTACPDPIDLLAILPFDEGRVREKERELHALFAELRVKGWRSEWFTAHPLLLDFANHVSSFGGP